MGSDRKALGMHVSPQTRVWASFKDRLDHFLAMMVFQKMGFQFQSQCCCIKTLLFLLEEGWKHSKCHWVALQCVSCMLSLHSVRNLTGAECGHPVQHGACVECWYIQISIGLSSRLQ